MATVVYFVTRKEEVPEKDDEYLIKGIVSELIENEESQIYKLLDKSDKTVKDFLEKTGEIKSSISGVDQQTRNLISVLNNNQSRGQWAEFQVEDLLGIMEYKDGIHYESQKIMNSGTKPDFTFYLPDSKTINMDSKFPLNLYMQLSKLNLDLEDETLDEISRKQITESIKTKNREFIDKAIKTKIDETSGREGYISAEEDTVDFVLMYIPLENLYHFLLTSEIGAARTPVIQYAFSKKVILVSPQTLMAYLETIRHSIGAVSGLETNTGAYFAFADVVDSKAKLIDVEKDTLVFPLGQAGIKTVADGAKYTFRKRFQATFATSGAEQLAAGDDLKFNFGDGTLSNTQEKNIIIIPTESVNAAANIGNGTVANSTVTTITGITSTATIRVGDFYFVGTNGPFQTRSVVNSSAIVVDSAPTASGNLLRTFPKDYPISLDDDSSANVVISASSDTMTIDLNETLNSTMDAKVFVDLVDENNNKVDKTVKQTEVAIDVNTHGGANANNVTGTGIEHNPQACLTARRQGGVAQRLMAYHKAIRLAVPSSFDVDAA